MQEARLSDAHVPDDDVLEDVGVVVRPRRSHLGAVEDPDLQINESYFCTSSTEMIEKNLPKSLNTEPSKNCGLDPLHAFILLKI
jgi:hypothetical protein